MNKLYFFSIQDYDVDWYGGGSVITNPFVLNNEKGNKEDEVYLYELTCEIFS